MSLGKRIEGYSRLLCRFLFGERKQVVYEYRYNRRHEKLGKERAYRIRKDFKGKIRIAFIYNSSSLWIGDELFEFFRSNSKFDPYIIVPPFFNGTDNIVLDEYRGTIKFFMEKGYKTYGTVRGMDIHNNKGWYLLGRPQIVIYGNPHMCYYPIEWKIAYLPSDIFTTYIPYGFFAADIVQDQYNSPEFHNLLSRFYVESRYSQILAKKYSNISGRNVVYSGYPKMDFFYEKKDRESIRWKGDPENKKKHFIFSPHHTLHQLNYKVAQSSFDMNYRFMLDMAKKYKGETCWIFRPHPLLKKAVVASGLFSDYEEWNRYVEEWNSLPNAVYQESGSYFDSFISCDAIINDSVSFMTESLYAKKPMLYLRSGHEAFNEYGQELADVLTSCSGDDYETIEKYICGVIDNRVALSKEQIEFFEKYLDYYLANGVSAGEFIYKDIVSFVEKKAE